MQDVVGLFLLLFFFVVVVCLFFFVLFCLFCLLQVVPFPKPCHISGQWTACHKRKVLNLQKNLVAIITDFRVINYKSK